MVLLTELKLARIGTITMLLTWRLLSCCNTLLGHTTAALRSKADSQTAAVADTDRQLLFVSAPSYCRYIVTRLPAVLAEHGLAAGSPAIIAALDEVGLC